LTSKNDKRYYEGSIQDKLTLRYEYKSLRRSGFYQG